MKLFHTLKFALLLAVLTVVGVLEPLFRRTPPTR